MSNLNHEYENSKQTRDFEMLKLREELVKLRDRYERYNTTPNIFFSKGTI